MNEKQIKKIEYETSCDLEHCCFAQKESKKNPSKSGNEEKSDAKCTAYSDAIIEMVLQPQNVICNKCGFMFEVSVTDEPVYCLNCGEILQYKMIQKKREFLHQNNLTPYPIIIRYYNEKYFIYDLVNELISSFNDSVKEAVDDIKGKIFLLFSAKKANNEAFVIPTQESIKNVKAYKLCVTQGFKIKYLYLRF